MSIQGTRLTRDELKEVELPERTSDMGKEATEEEVAQVKWVQLIGGARVCPASKKKLMHRQIRW